MIFAISAVNGQEKNAESQSDKILLQKEIASEGWSVPAFADEKGDLLPGKLEMIDDVEIETTVNRLSEQILISVETCKSKTAESTWQQMFALRDYETYAINGRVFAYRVPGVYVSVENQRIVEYTAAVVIFNYVDEDGSGKFRRRCDASSKLGPLPEWVKAQGKLPVVKQSKN